MNTTEVIAYILLTVTFVSVILYAFMSQDIDPDVNNEDL